jgi:choline dehydrogenase-like flavoprotein
MLDFHVQNLNMENQMYDICVIGSGAGAGPIIYELSRAGKKVVVLEKGDHYTKEDFSKDEIAYTKRSIVTPNLNDEYHELEEYMNGSWQSYTSKESGWDFWNGNIVGGSSNFMSGFFHRLDPIDLKLKSTFGEVNGANVEDWPIEFSELEKYYNKVDKVVGVTTDTTEHPISKLIDKTATKLGMHSQVTPRAILSRDKGDRNACYYSNYCGSFGCSSGAKGSAREALINPALKTGNVTLIDNAYVIKLNSSRTDVTDVVYIDKKTNKQKTIKARIFVLASQAVESSRLLLNSKSKYFPNGLANNNNKQVGKNLLFSGGGIVSGEFDGSINISLKDLRVEGFFVNRVIRDWYFLDKKNKGGIVEFLFEHANPIRKANSQKWDNEGNLVWGKALYEKLEKKFLYTKKLDCEIFNDWLPHDNCFVTISNNHKDKYGVPVAKIRIGSHPQNEKVGEEIAGHTIKLLKAMGAKNINSSISPYPPQNLQAGGCRFGNNPKTSVLDKHCKAHEINNLFVTDGSFMPTGGSVPYTYTIYANSFRVAEYIKNSKLLL